MVYVPAGEFLMGSSNADRDEKPEHHVTLDAFWIDRTEVTNAQFARFLNDQGNQTEGGVTSLDVRSPDCGIEAAGSVFRPKAGWEELPAANVSWYGAQAYATWVGGRLPTEAEWEKAARGTDGRTYPWGNGEPNSTRANFSADAGAPVAVGSYPAGASPYGALDMAGNMWEWVADWYGEGYYAQSPARNPQGPDSGEARVLRGGSFYNSEDLMRCARRNSYGPYYGYRYIGFRVVVSPG